MLEQFKQYVQSNSLLSKGDRVLIAVSGGIDSVVLCRLFSSFKEHEFAIAHCNFQLRRKDSDEDEKFVRALSEELHSKYFSTSFDTSKYALEQAVSIQMAARELRYQWFEKIAVEHNYDKIAVAHNSNDVVETILLNLVRGTGIKGLTGIRAKKGRIIRPLLFASRNDITLYAKENTIVYRKDKSNSDNKYKRNFIRHEVIPLLEKINPSFNSTILLETEIFESVSEIYSKQLCGLESALLQTKENRHLISITKLKSLKITAPVLFDILTQFGFGYPVVKDIYSAIDSESGRLFLSDDYVLLKDRNHFIIEKRMTDSMDNYYSIRNDDTQLFEPINLSLTFLNKADITIPRENNKVALDSNKVKFPLTLRRWQKGDSFIPLGMNGRKKLSDFLIDRKIDMLAKDHIWVLLSGNQIIWVVGHQIDDRVKVTESTRKLLLLERKN